MKDKKGRTDDIGNPAALSAYSFNAVMQQVAQFYCHPTRGLGIDLYWVRKDFTAFGQPYTLDYLPAIPQRNRFEGQINLITNHISVATHNAGKTLVVQDRRVLTPPYNTQNNIALYQYYGTRDVRNLLQESRDADHEQFVKLLLLDRYGEVQFAGQSTNSWEAAIAASGNAVTAVGGNPEKQGSYLFIASIAEEGIADAGLGRHYSSSEFINQLVWATAHEIGHLITDEHIQSVPGADSEGHISVPNALMTSLNPAPNGISNISADISEILAVDLKKRRSVQ